MNKVIILITLLFSTYLHALEIEGIKVPEQVDISGTKLVLNGAAMRVKKIGFLSFDVYVGALYLSQKTTNSSEILASTKPAYISMTFARDVPKDKWENGWKDAIKAQKSKLPNVDSQITEFLKGFKDLKEKDVYGLTFLEQGLIVSTKGSRIEIKDKAFAKLVLSVWFNNVEDEDFRDKLLGK